jgi:hypothetical protein
MPSREEVREVIDEMAMKGLSAAAIGKELKKKSMDGVIDRFEIEQQSLLPRRPSKTLPRIVGAVALLAGIAAIAIGSSGAEISVGRRYSPARYGIVAVVLGLILIVKPGLSGEDL